MTLRITTPPTPDSPRDAHPPRPDAAAPRKPKSSPTPPGPVPAWLGRIGEPIYRAVITRRNQRFDRGEGVSKLEIPVVSVGNLSVGGTGKTPMVMHVLRILMEGGLKPCVAMRGYTRRSKNTPRPRDSGLLIDRLAATKSTPKSDEADQYLRAFPLGSLPIVAQPDRLAGIREFLDKPFQPTIDCVVLDDGFQHRRIARDFDIVLIDASRPPSHDHLLPRGWLREPPDSLRRASCVVITHAELCAREKADDADNDTCDSFLELTSFITRHHGKPPIAITSHVWTGLRRARSHAPENDDVLPLDHLLGRRVVAACAIGNPRGFITALERTLRTDRSRPGTLVERFILPDHDPFDEAVARSIAIGAANAEADAIVVTDKDWSKLRRYPSSFWPCPIIRPELSLVFNSGADLFERELLNTVREARERKQKEKAPA